jgi:hypothetical protein
MLMNERLVRVQACIRKLAWLPPESSTVPFCKEQYGYGYFLAPDAVFIMWTQETDTTAPFGWNYKPAEKHCWLIFCERKILFRLKKQAE